MTPIRATIHWAASAVAATLMAALMATTPQLARADVGMTQLQAHGLPITLIYPTATKAQPQSLGPFNVTVALGASPVRGNGRLVVMSHGTGGSALADHDLARTLANAGFVVAQPEHDGDNWRDQRLAGPESWKRRPVEVSKAIDAVMADARFGQLLDASKVGVHGMPAGGGTALSLAGGQWRMAQLVRHCKSNATADAGFCLFGAKNAQERAQRQASYEAPQESAEATALHGGPAVFDKRIAAVVLSVPLAAIFTDASLAQLKVPVGIVEATADTMLVPAFHSSRVLKLCTMCKVLGALDGAGHFDVLSPLARCDCPPGGEFCRCCRCRHCSASTL